MNPSITETESMILNGIEFNEIQIPNLLVKVMELKWATQLAKYGSIRIRHLDYFRHWDNLALGDSNDGTGENLVNNSLMKITSTKDVYVWCSSLPEISDSRLSLFSKHGNYNAKVSIHNPAEILNRIQKCLSKNHPGFWLQCGLVKYNRDIAVTKKKLNSQKFHHNIFQKAAKFKDDCEFRVSVVNQTFDPLHNESLTAEDKYIDLTIGSCSDIISIELFLLNVCNNARSAA